MSPVDPQDIHSASEYWGVLRSYFPLALIAGFMGVIMHQQAIFKHKKWRIRFSLVASEWILGASAGMACATLLGVFYQFFPELPRNASTEIGLCGFIAGATGKEVFHYFGYKFFGVNLRND